MSLRQDVLTRSGQEFPYDTIGEALVSKGEVELPNRACGKAAIVLSELFVRRGKETPPTQGQIDWFAEHETRYTAALLGIECGRTIDFDHRGTRLARSKFW